jgi:isoprenylcysteine carboxyl methyltransferase (ICMT) family protein YpbQ
MRLTRRRRLFINVSLVLLVLVLARIAEHTLGVAGNASLIIVVLMGSQTLAFAAPDQPRGIVSRRRLIRILSVRAIGFAAVSLLALGSYALQRIFILNDWHLQATVLWLLLPLFFSALLDVISSRPYVDEYWSLGRISLSGRHNPTPIAKRDIGSCFIKIFFYPMMFVYVEKYLGLFNHHWLPGSWTAAGIYDSLAIYCLLVDLIFGASGYALSLRILGNRVRSVNPYPAGWLVTIVCYSPFWDMVERLIVFQWHVDWIVLTKDWPVVQSVWLMMIACCLVVYAWATVEMGPKFSNLTYRGTVESGPYRLMKHPAYVSKVVSYWLITVPFVPMHGWAFAFQQCLALSLSCSVYYFRAKYEEKHLLRYPEYKAYASSRILRSPKTYILAS